MSSDSTVSEDNAPPGLSFLEWIRSPWSADPELDTSTCIERRLETDMSGYWNYLNEQDAEKAVEFIMRRIEVRSTEFIFQPADRVVPSFAEFRKITSGIGEAFCHPDVYEVYVQCISGVATTETINDFRMSREARTEGDRRELYGLTRDPDTDAMLELHSKRREIRALLEEADDWTYFPAGNEVRLHLCPIVKSLTIYISRERKLSVLARDWISHQMKVARDLMQGDTVPVEGLDYQNLMRAVAEDHWRNMSRQEFLEGVREEVGAAANEAEQSDEECEDGNSTIPGRPIESDFDFTDLSFL